MADPDLVESMLAESVRLHGIARRLSRQDADDLVQETLLRAYRSRHTFKPGTSVPRWLGTILRNVHRSLLTRRMRRREVADGLLEGIPARRPRRPLPSLRRVVDSLDDRTRRAFLRLSARQRTVFYLFAVEERTCAEIGRMLGMPPGTVMTTLHRGRARVRRAV